MTASKIRRRTSHLAPRASANASPLVASLTRGLVDSSTAGAGAPTAAAAYGVDPALVEAAVAAAIQDTAPSGQCQLSVVLPNGHQVYAFGDTLQNTRATLARNLSRHLRRLAAQGHPITAI